MLDMTDAEQRLEFAHAFIAVCLKDLHRHGSAADLVDYLLHAAEDQSSYCSFLLFSLASTLCKNTAS